MSNRVHVLIDGEQFGPYPEAEFRQHLADHKILRSDLVWREGLPEWIPAADLLAQLDSARPAVSAPSASRTPRSPLELAREAAAKGNPDAQFQLSLLLFEPGKSTGASNVPETQRADALDLLRAAAAAGHGEAQYTLGFRQVNGHGLPRNEAQAVAWFRKAAEQNHAVAQCSLGYMLDQGRGLARDYAEAARWYRKAAERGDAVAQNNLGMLLVAGQGIPKNDTEAARWFAQAAKQNVPGAQMNYGLLLAKGQGVAADSIEAYQWFNLAAAQGHANAAKNRDLLAPTLTREQLAEAQQRASQFMAARAGRK